MAQCDTGVKIAGAHLPPAGHRLARYCPIGKRTAFARSVDRARTGGGSRIGDRSLNRGYALGTPSSW